MPRRHGPSDPSSTAWRLRQIAGPDAALRYLQARNESPVPPAAESEVAPAPTRAAAAPAAGPMDVLFDELRRELARALPSLSTHDKAQVSALHGRIEALSGAGPSPRDLNAVLGNASTLRRLTSQGEHLVRNAGVPAPGVAPKRVDRVLAALVELKLALLRHGLHKNAGSASFETATELFKRLGHLTERWQEAPGGAAAWALVERDEARPLAVEVFDFLRAGHAFEAEPVWRGAVPPVDAGTLFFSGSDAMLAVLKRAAICIGMQVDPPAPPGADFAAQRWRGLRRSAVAVFDLGVATPQVFYELGMALACGSQLVLLAPQGADVPFDVAQTVTRYADPRDLESLLPDAIDGACYQVQISAPRRVDDVDALMLREIIGLSASMFEGCEVLCGRWRAHPASDTPRWFAVMPFRVGPNARWEQMAQRLRAASPQLEQIRGDRAQGQEIIASIWEELCRATHVSADLSDFNPNVCLEVGIAHALGRPTLLIGQAGTAMRLGAQLPGLAKWRCHEYGTGLSRPFNTAVDRFFAAA